MNKMIFSAVVISSGLAFANAAVYAAQDDDVLARVQSLKKENAAIKKENAALRENKALLEQKAALKPTSKPRAVAVESAPVSSGKRTDTPAKEMPAMDITHLDMGIARPTYHSGWSGPYGDGDYPGAPDENTEPAHRGRE